MSRGYQLACEECGEPLEDVLHHRRGRRFCSAKCRYRARDRERCQADPEGQREKSRRYYAANREKVIQRVIANRRAHLERFVMVSGHQEPDARLVQDAPRFTVVEKTGEEGDLVAARDPRAGH